MSYHGVVNEHVPRHMYQPGSGMPASNPAVPHHEAIYNMRMAGHQQLPPYMPYGANGPHMQNPQRPPHMRPIYVGHPGPPQLMRHPVQVPHRPPPVRQRATISHHPSPHPHQPHQPPAHPIPYPPRPSVLPMHEMNSPPGVPRYHLPTQQMVRLETVQKQRMVAPPVERLVSHASAVSDMPLDLRTKGKPPVSFLKRFISQFYAVDKIDY